MTPWADTHAILLGECMHSPARRRNEHLALISAEVDPGAHAVVLLDQAGWHTTLKLVVPENITLMALPARAPELNPVENIWRFRRDNWLSNRVFTSYDDILSLL